MDKAVKSIETELLAILHKFLSEMHSEQYDKHLSSSTSFDRDLGIDSLGKVELFDRIEKHFAVKLPQSLLVEAENLQQLIHYIQQACPTFKTTLEKPTPSTLKSAEIDLHAVDSLIDVLYLYQENYPDRPHIYLQGEFGDESLITYSDLYENASKVAAGLLALGLRHNQTVAIMLPTSKEFFYSFMGIWLAGGIPVPIYPPFRAKQIAEYATREAAVLKNAEAYVLITFAQAENLSKILSSFVPSLKKVVTFAELSKSDKPVPRLKFHKKQPAMIQYTSGSTSLPKGVLLTHANLLANIHASGTAIQISEKDSAVSWLPLYHDMGLIGIWFGSFYYGRPVTIMSPLTFLSRPERWLWAIHSHRATISAGPNFAYELCVKKIKDEDIQGLDLSSWRLAFNGAEAVNPVTIRQFYKRFAPYGFREECLYPVYGLAECSVALTFPILERKAVVDKIIREDFVKNNVAHPATAEEKHPVEFVSCGKPLPEHFIRIVDKNNQELPERTIGHLQFKGPSAMKEYYRNPEKTAEIMHDGWLDTGDMAYIADGELYITGRKKDIIIKAGRNFYPEEIEQIASQVDGIRRGCVIAFGVYDEKRATEIMVIIAETRETQESKLEKIRTEVRHRVTDLLGMPPDKIILVPPGAVPKTSSGKLQRSACKEHYLSGKIAYKSKPVFWQMLQLIWRGSWAKLTDYTKLFGKISYNIYVFIIVSLLLPMAYTHFWLVPKRNSHQVARIWLRVMFFLAGLPIKVENSQLLKLQQPVIFISNHASYLDGLILTAMLPKNTLLVVKKELVKSRLLRGVLKKLNYLTVDRFDIINSLQDTEAIKQAIAQNYHICFFPEGTFTYARGVRPFKLGAFALAVTTQTPLLPIGIAGTRQVLRDDEKLLNFGKIKITCSELIKPKSDDWKEVNHLRIIARKQIAKLCGEELLEI